MKKSHCQEQGVALVVTVIVVAMLAVVGVALMQGTAADRASSRSVANYSQARLAAEAGAASAEAMVADLISRYPDSATVWQNIGGGAVNGTNNEATVLYLRAQSTDTNLGASPAAFGAAVALLAQPLVSRTNTALDSLNTNPVSPSSLGSLLAYATNNKAMVNLNATNSSQTVPLVGIRSSTNPGAPVTAAQWIYLSKYGGATNATNPYVARYAFWVEDESFKFNINVGTNGSRGTSSLGLSAAEARLDGSWGSSSNAALTNVNFATVIGDRALLGGSFPTAATAAFPAGISEAAAAAELRFLTTSFSGGLDLSRGGARRFPLNQNTFAGNNIDSIKRVVAAITNTNACPDFGQRFYVNVSNTLASGFASRLNSNEVTTDHSELYLLRIAANIKDMVDVDSVPTIVTGTNVNSAGLFDNKTMADPTSAFAIQPYGGGNTNPPEIAGQRLAAIGKENIPRLQEYAIHGRVISLDPVGWSGSITNKTGATFNITIDHYLEFWNMGASDIVLTDYFIKIYNMPRMAENGTSSPNLADDARSVTLRLTNGVIPAGGVVVITTAPQGQVNTNLAPANVISAEVNLAERNFTGKTFDSSVNKATNSNNTIFNNRYEIQTTYNRFGYGTSKTDYGTAMVMGNYFDGFIDGFKGLPLAIQSGQAFDLDARNNDRITNSNSYYVRTGVLMGNLATNYNNLASTDPGFGDPLAAAGDPSALNEQLEMLIYSPLGLTNSRVEKALLLNTTPGTGSSPNSWPEPNLTFGFPNTDQTDPSKWPDCSSPLAGPLNAALVVLNGNFRTIGDLGFIADPARVKGDAGNIANVRGGGRTLRIGQSEVFNASSNRPGLWDGDQLSASRARAAWRLADIFTTNTNTTNVFLAGLVNPNGALRDGGAAMRAVWYGLTMLSGPEGSPGTTNKVINLANIVSGTNTNFPGLISRLTNTNVVGVLNPFWERGELSEIGGSYGLSNFVTNPANPANTANVSNSWDRSREEIVRRSIDMVTTRGSVFSVYAIGQSLQVSSGATNVLSSARMKQTFEIQPVLPPGSTNDVFPLGSVNTRFARVTNYTVRVLQTSYD